VLNDRREEQKIVEVMQALILAPRRFPRDRIISPPRSFPSQVVP
jgi:hypothetical protein